VDLFASDFECDCQPQYPFLPEEARQLFEKQESGKIYSMRADFTFDQAQDLDPPQPGREGWKMMSVSSLTLKLLNTPNDGHENASRAMILARPAPGGTRWFIAEWVCPSTTPLIPAGGTRKSRISVPSKEMAGSLARNRAGLPGHTRGFAALSA
jgi:hypothetical protein